MFVTAHNEHAVEAFDLNAVDYLLKPVREERLREAVRRIRDAAARGARPRTSIAVELGGVTRFVSRSEVLYVEAQGDYARLHTSSGSHLVRVPLTALEERWARRRLPAHPPQRCWSRWPTSTRSAPRTAAARCVVGGTELQVSRRLTRDAARAAAPAPAGRAVSDRGAAATGPGPGHRAARTAARRAAHVRRPREIDAQTELGEVYMRSLMRSQLRLALRGARGCSRSPWGCCRCCSRPCRGRSVRAGECSASRCPGWLLGAVVYPLLLAPLALRAPAERNERDFHDLVGPR